MSMLRLFERRRLPITLARSFSASPQGRQWDILERIARFSEHIPPHGTVTIAITSVAAAIVFRAVGAWAGSDVRFAAYLPAILAIGLLAGVATAIGSTIAVVIIDWSVFYLPHLQIGWLNHRELLTLLMFTVAAAFTIFFAHCCRVVLRRLRHRELTNEVLVRELDHRSRNIFALIEVIVRKTLADDPELANKVFGRIQSIQYANELLIRANSPSINIKSLLVREFVAYGVDRLRARGPEIEIEPETARHLILVIHELVTNAAKYGSLSRATGLVLVDWQRDGSIVTLQWQEKGGPKVEPPNKQGFGSQLIVQCIKALSGSNQSQFLPEGFACSMTLTLGK
jgi:two-component sensor histidine kinase